MPGQSAENREAASVPRDATRLLHAWRSGDEAALERLTPIVYQDLRRLARRCLAGERPGHSLQTSALINEAYIRLIDCRQVQWQDRIHFLAVSAQLMRRILVDHARRRNAKRGGGVPHLALEEAFEVGDGSSRARDLEALDDALNALAEFDSRKAKVVELRFFGGLSTEEMAEALRVSPNTILRDWNSAKAWLYREMSGASRGS
jgi:RNA polymerase sigma-70 factor (ECF subfamily)